MTLLLLLLIQTDLAQSKYRDAWTRDPIMGDPSWDSFERSAGNPIFSSPKDFTWTVNGFLFEDPVSGNWFAYPGLYSKGYAVVGPAAVLKSANEGRSWENLGFAIRGDRRMFDEDGGTPDVCVTCEDGAYHMVYDWCTPGPNLGSDGGLGYARAEKPEGPFRRARIPIHAESKQDLLMGIYKRCYGGSLHKRKDDWLVISAMSTPSNTGGSWALAAMTAKDPEQGPWSAPTLLIYPEMPTYHPHPVEFFPTFTHQGYVYAPATSVARNRTFQVVYRAPLDKAHLKESWELFQEGSVFHWEPADYERSGIWGQTFSAFVDRKGRMIVPYPSLDRKGVGQISIASRPWDTPYRNGFVVSAPNAPALVFTRNRFDVVTVRIKAESNGPFSILWNAESPLGSEQLTHAEAVPSHLTRRGFFSLTIDSDGWQVREVPIQGEPRVLASGGEALKELEFASDGKKVCWKMGGRVLFEHEGKAGRLGFEARKGTCLKVAKFEVSDLGASAPICLLPTVATMAAGMSGKDWKPIRSDDRFRYKQGLVSTKPGARAKYIFRGTAFRLLLADGLTVSVDGAAAAKATTDRIAVPPGPHAGTIRADRIDVPLDGLEFEP